MEKLKYYHVEIINDPKVEHVYTYAEFDIACRNDTYIIVNDPNFTKLCIKKSSRNFDPAIGEPSIYELKMGLRYADGIRYSLYTYAIKKPETIKKEIDRYIKNKYGYLLNINLDFIK